MNLVGKYVAIAYDSTVLLDDVYLVEEQKADLIKVQIKPNQYRHYRPEAVLAVFNNKADAEILLKIRREYLDWYESMKNRDKEMRETIKGFAKNFTGAK